MLLWDFISKPSCKVIRINPYVLGGGLDFLNMRKNWIKGISDGMLHIPANIIKCRWNIKIEYSVKI